MQHWIVGIGVLVAVIVLILVSGASSGGLDPVFGGVLRELLNRARDVSALSLQDQNPLMAYTHAVQGAAMFEAAQVTASTREMRQTLGVNVDALSKKLKDRVTQTLSALQQSHLARAAPRGGGDDRRPVLDNRRRAAFR